MDRKISLPIEHVDKPTMWYPLSENFCEAIEIARACVGKNASHFTSTCVHIHPHYIEASDNVQITRYPIRTKLKEGILVVGEFLKHVAEAEVTEISKTKRWVHFRNAKGLVIACRLSSDEDYPDLVDGLKVKGSRSSLPKSLAEAADRAQVFSAENQVRDRIVVSISGDRVILEGEGASGWSMEGKKIQYTGKPIKFMIAPEMLIDIVGRHNECKVSKSHLLINTGAYIYTTCLGTFDDEKK